MYIPNFFSFWNFDRYPQKNIGIANHIVSAKLGHETISNIGHVIIIRYHAVEKPHKETNYKSTKKYYQWVINYVWKPTLGHYRWFANKMACKSSDIKFCIRTLKWCRYFKEVFKWVCWKKFNGIEYLGRKSDLKKRNVLMCLKSLIIF